MTDFVTLDLHQHHVTATEEGAYLLSADGEHRNAKWIPKRLCQRLADGRFNVARFKAVELHWLDETSIKQGRLSL